MSIFEGMTGALDAVLGAPVAVAPKAGSRRTVRAVFREGPVTVLGEDGYEVTTVLPTLSGDRRAIGDLVGGGLVEPGNGKVYRCRSALPSGSPAPDARLTIELELTDAPA